MRNKESIKYAMRIFAKSIFILLISFATRASNADLVKVREWYYKASTSRVDAERFFKIMKTNLQIDPSIAEGYRGMSYMIKANYDFNPYYKLSYFIKGKDLLDGAIADDTENIELRFLRFCVQTNAPGFLGYNSQVSVDKKVIITGYNKTVDLDLKSRIKSYMLASKSCSKEEKKIFTK